MPEQLAQEMEEKIKKLAGMSLHEVAVLNSMIDELRKRESLWQELDRLVQQKWIEFPEFKNHQLQIMELRKQLGLLEE